MISATATIALPRTAVPRVTEDAPVPVKEAVQILRDEILSWAMDLLGDGPGRVEPGIHRFLVVVEVQNIPDRLGAASFGGDQ